MSEVDRMDLLARDYEWLTIEDDGRLGADMRDTTPAEMDRRLVIMQELQAGRLVLASQHRGAVSDRDTLASYVRAVIGRPLPGDVPVSIMDVEAVLNRLGGQ